MDQTTADRIAEVTSVLASAVTAALPLSAQDAKFREQVVELEKAISNSSSDAYFAGYQDLGNIAQQRSKADEDFKYALTVLGVDPKSDYGLSVVVAATHTANLVVLVSRLLGCTPDEVWHNYLLDHETRNEV